MAFQVIADPDKLRELGKAGLLWYYASTPGVWCPSVNTPASWDDWSSGEMDTIASRLQYAILLED